MSALQLGQPRYRPYPASIVDREMVLPSWSIDTPSRKSSLSLQRLVSSYKCCLLLYYDNVFFFLVPCLGLNRLETELKRIHPDSTVEGVTGPNPREASH